VSFFGWVVIGLIAGSVAQRITGTKRGGCLFSIAVGVLGAVVGGALFQAAIGKGFTGFNWPSLGVALVGAVLLLLVLDAVAGRSESRRRRR
jgi:uncharacterized membrane protein YeaQ/YmgE (transglycosylase-associated protein family)